MKKFIENIKIYESLRKPLTEKQIKALFKNINNVDFGYDAMVSVYTDSDREDRDDHIYHIIINSSSKIEDFIKDGIKLKYELEKIYKLNKDFIFKYTNIDSELFYRFMLMDDILESYNYSKVSDIEPYYVKFIEYLMKANNISQIFYDKVGNNLYDRYMEFIEIMESLMNIVILTNTNVSYILSREKVDKLNEIKNIRI